MSSYDAYSQPPAPQRPQGPQWQPHPGPHAYGGFNPWAPPPRPGIVPLMPLRLGDYINATIRLVRAHLLLLLALGAITGVLMGVFTALVNGVVADALTGYGALGLEGLGYGSSSRDVANQVIPAALLVVISFPLNVALLGLYSGVGAIAGRGSMGHKASGGDVRQTLRPIVRPILALSGIYLAFQAVAIPASFAIMFIPTTRMMESANYDTDPSVLLPAIGLFLLALLVIMLLSVPIGYLTARLSLTPTLLALERQADGSPLGAIAALRRSWQLTKGHGWRLFGITMLFGMVLGSAASLLTVPLSSIAIIPSIIASTLFSGLTTVVVTVLIVPIQACVPAIAYLDMRLRKEDLGAQIARHVGLA